ncbi:uncharacterized protein (DUF2141 family) [Paucibacter oligotrophus]|uniref:Uncharacterized protein (DUF2141 family) n=1 Tax=Roseateles oligotrophus TaxID=1769250 RepID=A0A840LF76_9BURK|nr:DUF2141 domain-containing protein [Roseateles oligotrophus]MBB4843957.1 uncharacterized protein (DUF2141 family) [Roseateles oligotrophus]
MKTLPSFPLALLLTAGLLLAQSSPAADMELEVQGVSEEQGQLLVSVFAEAKDWLRKPVLVFKAQAAERKDGKVLIQLRELPEGNLALNVSHDVNGNGRLDMNAMGMPTEPYGFSNNAAGMFGPPAFDKAQFSVKPGTRIVVQLN